MGSLDEWVEVLIFFCVCLVGSSHIMVPFPDFCLVLPHDTASFCPLGVTGWYIIPGSPANGGLML